MKLCNICVTQIPCVYFNEKLEGMKATQDMEYFSIDDKRLIMGITNKKKHLCFELKVAFIRMHNFNAMMNLKSFYLI